MNEGKISDKLSLISKIFSTDSVTSEEYLVIMGNLLIAFGVSGLSGSDKYSDLNLKDCGALEVAIGFDPGNAYLAAILQGNVIIKWSEEFHN